MKAIIHHTLPKAAILTAIVATAFAVNYLYAQWTGPTATPPDGNEPAPINVSNETQQKDGLLTLFGGLGVFGPMQIDDGTATTGGVLVSMDDAGNTVWMATSSLGLDGGGDLEVTIVTANDPNNESCSVTCPADTKLVGGGCDAVYESPLQVNAPTSGGDGWQCETSPNMSYGGYSGGLTCSALCASGSGDSGDGDAGASIPVCASGEMLVYNGTAWVCTNTNFQERVSDSCPDGQAIKTINVDGTVVCESAQPGSSICIYGDVEYTEDASCFEGPGLKGGAIGCSDEPYTYLRCRPDGSWERRNGCYDPSLPPPHPTCGT